MRWPALTWRDRLAVLNIAKGLVSGASGGSARESASTVREWLQQQRQTPRLIELLWEPLAVAALNQRIDAAAAAPFVTVLRRMFGVSRRDAAIGFPLLPLEELFAEPSQRFIESRGGEIRTGAPATIDFSGRALLVRTRGSEWHPPAVICAVPWHALPAVFPNAPPELSPILEAARNTAASPIVTVNLWFDRVITSDVFVGLPGRAMQWVFDKQRLIGGDSRHLSVVSSGATELTTRTNDELIALALREIRESLPAARAAELRRAVVVRERRASFSVAPGQPSRPPTATAVPALFLAGDWIDTGLPATIEGAVVSGHRAARMAGAYLRKAARG
jgi:squalene-associated FAD-dependent desaturase